jgi:hypothetical protein
MQTFDRLYMTDRPVNEKMILDPGQEKGAAATAAMPALPFKSLQMIDF